MRHHDVQKTGHPTDGAIAVKRRNRRLADFRLEPHRAAMAATPYRHFALLRSAPRAGKMKAAPGEPARPSSGALACRDDNICAAAAGELRSLRSRLGEHSGAAVTDVVLSGK